MTAILRTDRPWEVVTLRLGGEVFAVAALQVREILDLVATTEVPTSPAFVRELINVRGRVVPLADLRPLFGMPHTEPTIDTRIVVLEVELDGDPTLVGILADKVYEVTTIATAAMAETPRIGMRWRADFIRGVGKLRDDFIFVLDIERILGTADPAVVPAAAGEPLAGATA
jgi:purine-binding chemotaxis protein CheW